MQSNEIRKRFLEFFAQRGHRIVNSSSLVPANDPTLLFSNAGMNQFKDVFLGRERRDYSRATTSQKCVRAGGKHNDLEQVGRTTRHHTFFEMLGNFSFGDYFKKEAIPWAWELITREFAIPSDKLYVTIFEGKNTPQADIPRDDEAYECWRALGVPPDRIFALGMKDNFWQMGETGPCGPCSEIHYDMGAAASDEGHTECKFPCDCGRYVELWNLVFMQFNRDEQGTMTPLPRPSIDTGAGLERLASVLQGKLSNFETDLFRPLIEEAAALANVEYGANHDADVSLRIIADHARSATFLISDGVLPSNEGRGYVLRLIMRRALYHGQTLGLNEPFLYKISSRVVDMMKDAYPELVQTAHHVAKAIKIEEERYAQTTRAGLERLEKASVVTSEGIELPFYKYREHTREFGGNFPTPSQAPIIYHTLYGRTSRPLPPTGVQWVPGDELFELHDTFGLRSDFVRDIVKSASPTSDVDLQGYQVEMQKQRERARASWKGAEKKVASPLFLKLAEDGKTVFDGYTQTTSTDCKIAALVVNGEAVSEVQAGAKVEIVLDHTPFYAESGGQVGDTGQLVAPGTDHEIAHVQNTYQPVSGLIVHKAVAREGLRMGDVVTAVVDAERRDATRRNHTATHLLHAALRKTLGTHVKQAGSLVAPERLRFDFTHYTGLGEQDLLDIVGLVNEQILKNEEVVTTVMDLDTAVNTGAMALFGEKYADQVRVLTIDDFSKELCGGTHVRRTGDIGLFKVVSEGSVAAGTRRIEAITGWEIVDTLRHDDFFRAQLTTALSGAREPSLWIQAIEELKAENKRLRKDLSTAQKRLAMEALHGAPTMGEEGNINPAEKVVKVKDVKLYKGVAVGVDRADLRDMIDALRRQIRMDSGVIVLGWRSEDKAALVVSVSKDLTARLDAAKIVRAVATHIEGSGGGRKDLAEAGGKNPAKLDEAIQAVPGIIEQML